jgi:general secretion pathway protein M
MKQFLAGLGTRERYLLIAGGGLLLVLLLYALAWRPFSGRVEQLRDTVQEQRALEQWMEGAAAEVRQLRGTQGANRAAGQSLLSLADRTARQNGLGPAIKRVEPEGTDKVRLQLEQAPFDDLMTWIETLVSQYHARIDTVTVEARDQPGVVNARVILQAPAT